MSKTTPGPGPCPVRDERVQRHLMEVHGPDEGARIFDGCRETMSTTEDRALYARAAVDVVLAHLTGKHANTIQDRREGQETQSYRRSFGDDLVDELEEACETSD